MNSMMAAALIGAVVFCTYLFPWLVAHFRGHQSQLAIFVVNLCFGWTLLGWFAALVWACTSTKPHVVYVTVEKVD